MPVSAGGRPERADEVGQRGPDGQRPDEDSDGEAATPPEPAGQHLQGDRVDRREPDSRREAPRQRRRRPVGEQREPEVARRRDGRPDREEAAGRQRVGGTGRRQRQRPRRESELNGDRQQGQVEARRLPLRREERRDGRGAEPGGEGEQDAGGDDRELAPAAGGILRRWRRHSGRIV